MTLCSVQIEFGLFANKALLNLNVITFILHTVIPFAKESSWSLHSCFRAFYNYILGSKWRGGRNDQHASFLSNWISGLRISAEINFKQVGEIQCMFLFKTFSGGITGFFLLQVSDSFDVFKACKDCNNQSYNSYSVVFFPQISEISGEIRG